MQKFSFRRFFALALALCILLCALPVLAAEEKEETPVRVIVVSKKKLTLTQEDTYALTVSAKDGGSLPRLQWESSRPEVVSVDQNGKLTALEKGKAKIKVSSVDGSTDASVCTVTVKKLKTTPIKATLEGNVYNSNYNRVSGDAEAAVRKYCERLGDSKAEKAVRAAVECVGTAYSKMDCSELTQHAYRARGIKLSRVSDDQAQDMSRYRRESGELQVGDLCFLKFPSGRKCSCGAACRRYEKIHHAAIYLGKIDGTHYVVDSSSNIGKVIIRGFSGNTIAGMHLVFAAGK